MKQGHAADASASGRSVDAPFVCPFVFPAAPAAPAAHPALPAPLREPELGLGGDRRVRDRAHAGHARDTLRERAQRCRRSLGVRGNARRDVHRRERRVATRVTPVAAVGGFKLAVTTRVRSSNALLIFETRDAHGDAPQHARACSSVKRRERRGRALVRPQVRLHAREHGVRHGVLQEAAGFGAVVGGDLDDFGVVVRRAQAEARGGNAHAVFGAGTRSESELHLVPVPRRERRGERRRDEGVERGRVERGARVRVLFPSRRQSVPPNDVSRRNLRGSAQHVQHLLALHVQLRGVRYVLPRAPAAFREVRARGLHGVRRRDRGPDLGGFREAAAPLDARHARHDGLPGRGSVAQQHEPGLEATHPPPPERERRALHLHLVPDRERRRGGGGRGGGGRRGAGRSGGGGGGWRAHPPNEWPYARAEPRGSARTVVRARRARDHACGAGVGRCHRAHRRARSSRQRQAHAHTESLGKRKRFLSSASVFFSLSFRVDTSLRTS